MYYSDMDVDRTEDHEVQVEAEVEMGDDAGEKIRHGHGDGIDDGFGKEERRSELGFRGMVKRGLVGRGWRLRRG